jgi:hypothetical protein
MKVLVQFERAWLVGRIDWEEHFRRLLGSPSAARSEVYRKAVEQDRAEVAQLFRHGDEVWSWRSSSSPSFEYGIALLRAGDVVRAWSEGLTM